MNIVWMVDAALTPMCGSKQVKVVQSDVWNKIKISEPTVNVFKGIQIVDITRNEQVFKNVPINWYLIEN